MYPGDLTANAGPCRQIFVLGVPVFNTLIKKMEFFDSISNHFTSALFLEEPAG